MRTKRRTIVASATATLLLLPFVVVWLLRQGPTAAGPNENPVVTWNRERSTLTANADRMYFEAVKALDADAPDEWEQRAFAAGRTVPDDIAAWVASHESLIGQLRAGAELEDCRFELSWDGPTLDIPVRLFRKLVKFTILRARLAETRSDIETFTDSLLLCDAIARHAAEQPTVFARIAAVAGVLAAQHEELRPLGWPGANWQTLSRYSERITPLDRPLPSIRYAIETEFASCCWAMKSSADALGWKRLIAPDARLFGEAELAFRPGLELADAPLARRLDFRDPLRIQMADESLSRWNTARAFSFFFIPALGATFDNDGRATVLQRGNRAVRAIFEQAGPERLFPESLMFLDHDELSIDAYSGKPLVYRRTENGFTLYSVGADRRDDGGKFDPRWGESPDESPEPTGEDLIFWPLPD